jgi:molybdopterin-guanine dinucleotide biosynthesis protein A
MLSAAILSGGAARRFNGRDKGALIINGRSILERQLVVLGSLTDDIMIVGRDPSWLTHPPCRYRVVFDRFADCGPLAGLDAALAEAVHQLVVIVACDMPYITAPLLGRLAALAAGDDVDAAVPRTTRGDHPLCAAYTQRCRPVVLRRLTERGLAMKDLLKDLRVLTLDEQELRQFGAPQHLLANVNTPDDYASLREPSGEHTR